MMEFCDTEPVGFTEFSQPRHEHSPAVHVPAEEGGSIGLDRSVSHSSYPQPLTVITVTSHPEPHPVKTFAQISKGHERLQLVRAYEQLIPLHGKNGAVEILRRTGDVSRASLDRWVDKFKELGFPGLIDGFDQCGRRPKYDLTAAEQAALKAHFALTNRNASGGSAPEALRRAAAAGHLRPELVDEFARRQRDSAEFIPESMRHAMTASPATIQAFRNPTEANLTYHTTPGSMMWLTDSITGLERPIRAGDVLEADDATPNVPVCVPWPMGGCKVSERWGVKLARFQWLVGIDVGSRKIVGYSYTARPKSSYRAEDIVSFFGHIFAAHGLWEFLRLERGAWEAELVNRMIAGLNLKRWTARSPRQKPFIEKAFNVLWTKLSHLPGDVGRFMGEVEATSDLETRCRSGSTDPKKHFPMLSDVLAAFDQAIAEVNQTPIDSDLYGRWIPDERFAAQIAQAKEQGRFQPLPPQSSFLFAPVIREWTVKKGIVEGLIPVADGESVQFSFSSDFLPHFDKAKVRVHFDPWGKDPTATIVLLQNVRDVRAGTVLGRAVQVNKVARHAREVFGYGTDPDVGLIARKSQSHALRRTVKAILPDGAPSVVHHIRDTKGNAATIGGAEEPKLLPDASGAETHPGNDRPIRTLSESDYAAAAARRARQTAARLALAEEIPGI